MPSSYTDGPIQEHSVKSWVVGAVRDGGAEIVYGNFLRRIEELENGDLNTVINNVTNLSEDIKQRHRTGQIYKDG